MEWDSLTNFERYIFERRGIRPGCQTYPRKRRELTNEILGRECDRHLGAGRTLDEAIAAISRDFGREAVTVRRRIKRLGSRPSTTAASQPVPSKPPQAEEPRSAGDRQLDLPELLERLAPEDRHELIALLSGYISSRPPSLVRRSSEHSWSVRHEARATGLHSCAASVTPALDRR